MPPRVNAPDAPSFPESSINAVEKMAHDTAKIVEAAYDTHAEVTKFTPSINAGVRYVGVTIEGRQFLVTIEVKEA